MKQFDGTTILTVRKNNEVVMVGDGQVSMGNTILKSKAKKVRTLYQGKILAGFAGGTADAFTLFERFEGKLEKHQGNMMRAAVEMAKDWRTDRVLRRLDAVLLVADKTSSLLITGVGDVIEPDHPVLGIGSGGHYAEAAARALIENTELSAAEIGEKSLHIAADICTMTNHELTLERLTF